MLDRYDSVEFETVTYQAESGGLSCPESVTRLHYYDISSLPTLLFNGTTEIVGAGDEAIDNPADRALVMDRVIDWLAPDPLAAGASPPPALQLPGNAPNPFNPRTEVRYRLAGPADVVLGVFDLQGRQVRRIAAGRQAAGEHGLAWDGRNDDDRPLPAGTYVYRLTGAGEVHGGKMAVVK